MLMGLIVVCLHGHLLYRTVDALHLAVGAKMLDLGEPGLEALLRAHAVEEMTAGGLIPLAMRELKAVVGPYHRDLVGFSGNQVAQELGGDHYIITPWD